MKTSTPKIDLEHYKSILKDQSAVNNAQKVLSEFKPVDYDVSKWNGVVEAFEGKAVSRVLVCLSGFLDWVNRGVILE